MTDQFFTADEQEQYEAKAHARGFKTLRDYVQALIKRDIEEHEADEDADLEDELEMFRHAWADAMEGRTITYEEFRRRMLSDDD